MDVGIPNPYYYDPRQRWSSADIVRCAKELRLKSGPNWLRGINFAAVIQFGGYEHAFAELLLFDRSCEKYNELLNRLSSFPMTIDIDKSMHQFFADHGLQHLLPYEDESSAAFSAPSDLKPEPELVRNFIARLRESESLLLMTEGQTTLSTDAKATFEWIGKELLELLETKQTIH